MEQKTKARLFKLPFNLVISLILLSSAVTALMKPDAISVASFFIFLTMIVLHYIGVRIEKEITK